MAGLAKKGEQDYQPTVELGNVGTSCSLEQLNAEKFATSLSGVKCSR